MRKVLFVLAALLITAPAMAVPNVDITCTQQYGGWITIGYTVTRGPAEPRLRALALEVEIDIGAIVAIRGYKTGESTAADPGYGIFPGSIDLTDPLNPVWGDPIAPATDPGAAGTGLSTKKVVLEMGSLYDAAVPGNEPVEPSGDLCQLRLSNSTTSNPVTVTVVEEKAFRGGIVMEDPGVAPTTNVGGPAPTVLCSPIWDYSGPDTAAWNYVNNPSYWDSPRQCYGDADSGFDIDGRGNHIHVTLNDAAIFLTGLRTLAGPPGTPIDPAVHTWISADFNHSYDTDMRGNETHVTLTDASLLLTYLRNLEPGVPGDCSP